MPITGKMSVKPYRCTRCGAESERTTNHWGEIYPQCADCSWKTPRNSTVVMECLEPMPEEFSAPPKWKRVALGDLCTITRGVRLPYTVPVTQGGVPASAHDAFVIPETQQPAP